MAETFTLYKLIVLYMLDRVDFPLTTSQISEFILDKGYTTYFRLQSALAELTDSGLLKIELTHNRTLYNLTEEGAATINYFRNKISPEIRQEIDNFIFAGIANPIPSTEVCPLFEILLEVIPMTCP